MTQGIEVSESVTIFLEALEAAEPEDWCSPPGLKGPWKVRWIRKGLESGALVVHNSGQCIAMKHGPEHRGGPCPCALCRWLYAQKLEDWQSPTTTRKIDLSGLMGMTQEASA